MKTFKVNISGVTPHTIEATNKIAAIRQTKTKWAKQLAGGRTLEVTEWKPYTVDSLIAELQQYAGSTPVCFPSMGGTCHAQSLPVVMGVVSVDTVPSWRLGDNSTPKVTKMVCFESHVIPSNVS